MAWRCGSLAARAPDSLVDVRTGVIAAQAEFEKDGNAAVKAAAIERAKAVAKQAVAEVAGSVRGSAKIKFAAHRFSG